MKTINAVSYATACLILTTACLACLTPCPVVPDLEDQLTGPVVMVEFPDGSGGSGTVVGQDLVLTCAHVVWDRDREGLEVDGKPAVMVKVDLINDLALLSVPGLGIKPALLADKFPTRRLVKTWSVGFPYLVAEIITEGSVGAAAWVTSPVAPGNSGGGVFVVDKGMARLVGIVQAMACRPGYPPAMHAVKVIPVEKVKEFLGR